MSPLLLSTGDTAKILGVSRAVLYRWHNSGRLGPLPVTFGSMKRWSAVELSKWVEAKCPAREVWQRGGDGHRR